MPWSQFENGPQNCSQPKGNHATAGHRDSYETHDGSSHRLLLPFRVSPDITAMLSLVNETASLLPRFFAPSAFSERHGATYLRLVPEPCRLRCVFRVSLPLDALLPMTPPGLIPSRSRSWGSPFEVFLRSLCRTSFSNAESLMGFRRILRISAALSGVFHTASSTPAGLGFNQVPRVDCLLGFLPSEVSRLRSWRLATLLPSRAFASWPVARPRHRRLRVFTLRRLGASLSRSTSPHRLFHLAFAGTIYVPNERV